MSALIIALAYFAAARLGAALSIPPDFASAVWPAAGIALSAFLFTPARVAIPAVLIGATAANLYRTSGGFFDLSLVPVLTGLAIGVGSTAQAWFGAWLYRRFLRGSQRWDDPRFILKFCAIVVLVGCIVAATVGSFVLLANDFIPVSRFTFNWITWWVGDSIGVLLVTPMVQVILAPESSFSRSRKLKTFIPMLLILVAVYGLFIKSVEHSEEQNTAALKAEADHLARTVESRLVIAENKLTSYAALFLVSEFISFDEFNRFSERVMENDDAFQAVGWTEVLNHQERLKWESYFQKQGFPDFYFTELAADGSLVPAPERDEYYPVLYLHPLEDNRKAFGLNLAANPTRKEALIEAANQNSGVATAPITLAQTEGEEKAIIVYTPVFGRENPESLMGYASGVLRVEGILGDSAERAREAGLKFSLYDVTDSELPLFEQEGVDYTHLSVLSYVERFAGREYRLDISPGANYKFGGDDWTSYVILTGGFVIAALFQIFALTTSGTIESVTRQVEARTRELKHAVSKANAASAAKSTFLANMSHELRTPLNAISGFIYLTLDSKLTNQQRDFLQKAGLASETLLGLINQTLDYAKIESGKMELETGEVNVRKIARKMEALFSQIADDKQLDFKIDVHRNVPMLLIGDHLRIEQIVMNLLSNAFKFTSAGNVGLTFSYGDAKLTIRVMDSGSGIPPDKLEHIFLAFGQADASTSRHFGGTGLGLSISKRIAKLMGGDILVRSAVGEGSEFFVFLRLSLDARKQVQDEPNTPVPMTNSLQGLKILIVEDVVLNQILMQELLHKQGVVTSVAENGEVAVDAVQSDTSIDMVLMDVQMPVMDGYEATRRIRAMKPDLAVIGMTANAMESDIQACLEAGMNAHVAKPVDPRILTQTLLQHRPQK